MLLLAPLLLFIIVLVIITVHSCRRRRTWELEEGDLPGQLCLSLSLFPLELCRGWTLLLAVWPEVSHITSVCIFPPKMNAAVVIMTIMIIRFISRWYFTVCPRLTAIFFYYIELESHSVT